MGTRIKATQLRATSITDLTGTTWIFNDILIRDPSVADFYINFNSNNSNWTKFDAVLLYDDNELYYNDINVYYKGNWNDNAFKTIEITGGNDVTNNYLISFLQNNATQVTPPSPSGTNKTHLGSLSIIKKHFGDLEIIKEVLNGATIYESVQTYTITTTITNGSYTGDTEITNTASVTISANTGYSLPSTISVSGATYTYNSSTGVVSLSNPTGNVTIEATCVASYPVKSDIITMNVDGTNRRFRVLKNVSGSVFEVMCLYFHSSTSYSYQTNSNYANNTIDNYCNNTFYNALNTTAKNAIVDKTFRQEQWGIGISSGVGEPYYIFKNPSNNAKYCKLYSSSYGSSITRHCYTLSLKSLIDYFEVTTNMTLNNTTFTSNNIKIMFDTLITNEYLSTYFMDAGKSGSSTRYCCKMAKSSGDNPDLWTNEITTTAKIISVFQIDLSKIDFTIEA